MFKIKVLIAIKVIWLWSFSEHTSIMAPKVCKLTFASRHPPHVFPAPSSFTSVTAHLQVFATISFHFCGRVGRCCLCFVIHLGSYFAVLINVWVHVCVWLLQSSSLCPAYDITCWWMFIYLLTIGAEKCIDVTVYLIDFFSLSLWCEFTAAKSGYLYLKIAGALDGFPQQLNSLNHCIMTHWGGAY